MKSRIGKINEYRGEKYITCEEVVTFLLDYLTRDVTPEEESEFERHLSICPSCIAYVKSYKETVRLGRVAMRAEEAEKPPELSAELVRAILRARE